MITDGLVEWGILDRCASNWAQAAAPSPSTNPRRARNLPASYGRVHAAQDGLQQSVSGAVARWRARHGLSLEAAAARLGVAHTTVRNWEKGRRPTPQSLALLIPVLLADSAAARSCSEGEGPAPEVPQVSFTAFRSHRVAAGMTLASLARRLSVSPAMVSRWEAGTRRPAPHHLPRLQSVLRISERQLAEVLAEHPPGRFHPHRLPGLRRMRADAGFSQKQLAAALGISPITMYSWELGRVAISQETVEKIAAFLGISEIEVLTQGSSFRPDAVSPHNGTRTMRRTAGMTQNEAAALLGLSVPTLARYERGERSIPVLVAQAMARVYRRPLATVYAQAGVALPHLPAQHRWTKIPFPSLIERLRLHRGMSRSRLARLVGVAHQTIERWETGDRVPMHRLPALAYALDAPLVVLTGCRQADLQSTGLMKAGNS